MDAPVQAMLARKRPNSWYASAPLRCGYRFAFPRDIEVPTSQPTFTTLLAVGFCMSIPRIGVVGALALSGSALCLLALAPLGCRLGWWSYGLSLYRLIPISGIIAAVAVLFSVLTLALGWSRLRARDLVLLCAALVLGGALVSVPAQ